VLQTAECGRANEQRSSSDLVSESADALGETLREFQRRVVRELITVELERVEAVLYRADRELQRARGELYIDE